MLHTCCFIGHRKLQISEELCAQLSAHIEDLIQKFQVDTFLFGSQSRFDDLCHKLVSQLKEKYPHIRRIYVRAEFPVIEEAYRAYLLERYEDTFYPSEILGAGKAVYIKRNQILIDRSRFCVFYLDDTYTLTTKSGTKIAFAYATKRNKCIYNSALRSP